jgi:uncharacterized repeat protein (TIGR01451 family)
MRQVLLVLAVMLCFGQLRLSAQASFCSSFNTPPSDLCGAVCIYCDIENLISTTAGYTSQTPIGFCGSIENEQWLGVVAQTPSVTIIATATNCTDGNGIQLAVYKDCSSNPLACHAGAFGQGTVPISCTLSTIPGEVYYVVIDGFAGDQCDFQLNVIPPNALNSGAGAAVDFDGSIVGPDTVCPLNTVAYTLSDLAGTNLFYWDGPPGMLVDGFEVPTALPGSLNGNFDIRFPVFTDSISFSVTPANACIDTSGTTVLTKTVYARYAPTLTLPDTTICALEYFAPWGELIFTSGVYQGALPGLGCDTIATQTVNLIGPVFSSAQTSQTYNCNTGATDIVFSVNSSSTQLLIEWTAQNGNFSATGSYISIVEAGYYTAHVYDPMKGCSDDFTTYFALSAPSVQVNGGMYLDIDGDCQFSSLDQPIALNSIRLQSLNDVTLIPNVSSDMNGIINTALPVGSYLVDAIYPYTNCPQVFNIGCNTTDPLVVLLSDVSFCSKTSVSLINSDNMVRCINNSYLIQYINHSPIPVNNAIVQVLLDSNLVFINANVPLISQQANLYTFDLGTVFSSKTLTVNFNVPCNAQIGENICTKVTILPTNTCVIYQGPVLQTSGICSGDSAVFTITNTGLSNMTSSQEYFWFEQDQVGLTTQSGIGSVLLNTGASQSYSFATQGNPITFVAQQNSNFPYASQAGTVIEGCNALNGMLTITQTGAPYSDQMAEQCNIVLGSYDPNDKKGVPTGIGIKHYIDRGSDMHYTIRFQNTGNYPAFAVSIRDTLSPDLNQLSARMTGFSHPCQMSLLNGNILVFDFPGIVLPDSVNNEPESHGFVSFSISQLPNTAEGIEIKNQAAIYFDFNDPIITNQTLHTNGIPRPTNQLHEVNLTTLALNPNPFKSEVTIQLDQTDTPNGVMTLTLYDAFGKLCDTKTFTGSTLTYRNDALVPGVYLLKITARDHQNFLASGKLIKL